MGGASAPRKRDEEEQVFLSKEILSLVTIKMPHFAIRILKGYKDSMLTHLLDGTELRICSVHPFRMSLSRFLSVVCDI